MRASQNWLIAFLLISPTVKSSAQSTFTSTELLWEYVDSASTKDGAGRNIRVLWMGSTIEIRKTINLNYNLKEARKWRKDESFIPSSEDTLRHREMSMIASQNCHSYALEKYFASAGLKNTLFTNRTVLTENRYMDNILSESFKKISTQNIKNKKCKDCTFHPGSIIVFRIASGSLIHSVYYDGGFYSKYGGWAAKTEGEITPIIKRYWDSKIVEEYVLDQEKIDSFLEKRIDNR